MEAAAVRKAAKERCANCANALSADEKNSLSACEDRTVRIWDVEIGGETRSYTGNGAETWSEALFPDGRRILSGDSDHDLIIWELPSG